MATKGAELITESNVVLVTGAARGIGLEIAKQLTNGSVSVIGVDITLPEDPGVFAEFLQCDLREEDQIVESVGRVVGTNGRLDGLVNNAAVTPVGPFLEVPLTDLDEAYSVNVRGLFCMAREAGRAMSRLGGGSIVNLSSVNAYRGVQGTAVYSLTKGAVSALTKTIAVELASVNVRCNAIAPAPTATRRVMQLLDDEQVASRVARIPWGRLGRPNDIAAAAVWLLSPEASFITGVALAVDGGYLAYGS